MNSPLSSQQDIAFENIFKQISKAICLTEKDIHLLRSKLHPKLIKASEIIHSQGSVCNFEAYIQKGILRSFYTINGNERIIQFFEEGQWVGDFKSFVSRKPSKITIQAIEDCELYVLSKDGVNILSDQILNWDKIGEIFYKNLFIQKDRDTESLLTSTPEERYSFF